MRVYVVDDEQIITGTIAAILNQSGFDATPFTNPVEALDQTRSQAPNLLITDVVMPQMSGIDLAIQAKEICPSCKIVLFSGQAGTADLLQVARQRGHDFQVLSKPIHPTDLLLDIRNLTES
jgi:CheY-like chemotaxis protein